MSLRSRRLHCEAPLAAGGKKGTAFAALGSLIALIALVALVALVLVAHGIGATEPERAEDPELTGPLAPSFHIPPVRTAPPARTRPIVRPTQYDLATTLRKQELGYRRESLRLAIEDLSETFGRLYPRGPEFLQRWEQLARRAGDSSADAERLFAKLRDDALLSNPLLNFDRLLVVKRQRGQLGLPTNHQCNTALEQSGYDNEIAVLTPVQPGGTLTTLFRPRETWYVGEVDLHHTAARLLFAMPNGRTWQIHEIGIDGSGLRQISREVPDVDNFDPCYVPNGRIVFASTASFTGVPCWHGKERACCLYSMRADGTDVRQLCYDQDLDLHPSVLGNGQVIFSRWDYTGILHAYVRPLMVMNPDGTGQRAVYGSNSYYPNCLFFPRGVPGQPHKIVAVLAGYHGRNRMGELAVLDVGAGWAGDEGIVQRITHRGEPIVPVTLDALTVDASPQFLHPYPLSDKYILTAMQRGQQPWGIYLVDIFDNVVPVLTDSRFDFFEPIPVARQARPPVLPDRVDPTRDDAVIVLHDIYKGEGLKDVPRGTIKRLRIAAYHFGYPGLAGPDKIGRGGPWEAMRILGTVPVYEDGSAKFSLPANTPVSLQALDREGKAVQLMRSWYTAMPGETASCVGCHETPRETPASRPDIAARKPVVEIEPWYGPARGFDFAREVQPVLDEHCVSCHNGQPWDDGRQIIDLRDESLVPNYAGLPLTWLGATRLDVDLTREHPGRFQPCPGMPQPYGERKTMYTPAYEALIPFIRRVNVEDHAGLLPPGEYHADTSELIRMLGKGHHTVQLDAEAWDRLITWIDLNGPCHGTWGDVAAIPRTVERQRRELALATGGPRIDPERIPETSPYSPQGPAASPTSAPTSQQRRELTTRLLRGDPLLSRPSVASEAGDPLRIELEAGLSIEFVPIPAGRFIMGDTTGSGEQDECPAGIVTIDHDFWISRTEITNAQLRAIVPDHRSGVFTKRQIDQDGPGIELDGPRQPAIRVSWNTAMEFCRRLSTASGRHVTLPTEGQWEYAARAGTLTDLSYGAMSEDFSRLANMADRSLACLYTGTAGVVVLQPIPARMDCDDQAIGTADVASYLPNPWGLSDMHGNAAEWTRSICRSYPYDDRDGRNITEIAIASDKRVVRGGSFHDRPLHCRGSHRRAYPAWQSVHDVGFRVVVE